MSGETRDENELPGEIDRLRCEIERLRAQVSQAEEAQETLRAIRAGEVDALLVSGPQGDRIYTLQSAEQPYRILVQQMHEGAITLVADGTIYYANHAFADMLGRPLEKVMGLALREYVAEADRPLFDALFQQALTGASRGEMSLIAEDDTLLPAYLSFSLLKVDHVTSICVAVTDLREQKRSEQVLASERFARAILNQAGDAIVVWNTQRRAAYLNTAARRLARLDLSESTLEITPDAWGKRCDDRGQPIPPEDWPLNLALRGQVVSGREVRMVRDDGSHYDLIISATPLREADGSIIGAVATFNDITERKQAEEQVRLQAAALEAAANGIAITDGNGTILWVNQAFTEMTGYSREELIGQNHRILKSGEQDETFYREMWGTILQGKVWHGELVNRRKTGELYVEEQTIAPLKNGQGAIIHFISVKQDISARKTAEQALSDARRSAERAKAAAEQASRAKDHFLAVLSHELRTPLTPVLATVSLLQAEGSFDADTRESLEMVRRNVELEARLIDDLLDMTRIARGKVELNRCPVPLCEVIRRAVEVCKPDIQARRLDFGVDIGPNAPYIVEADIARLQQVFWNLLKNAIKFTPHGGCVGIRCRRVDGHVIAEVNDSGEGIEQEALGRIFNAFEQAERSITRQFGGLGLGLAICKALVEMHGGSIEAHSDGKGKGATFRVRLPLCAQPSAAGLSGHLPSQVGAPAKQRRLRILLVEDHGDTARIMKRVLATHGHEVQTAGDVATATGLALQGSFDLLISDLGLPDASGVDLLRALRARGLKLPAIALSGYGQDEDIERSKAAGFDEHLIKPVDFARLRQVVERFAQT